MLFVIPNAFAKFELENIKVYVNNERETGADEDGGDIDVNPSAVVDITIEINNDENTTTQARIKSILEDIDNGDDIKKELDWFDVDADDDRAKTISFIIPDDADIDNYDLELTIDYKYSNGTEGQYEIKYDVNVEKPKDEEEDKIDLESSFNNMTNTCNRIIGGMDTYFDYVGKFTECSNSLSTVMEERGTYKAKSEDCSGNLDVCKDEKGSAETDKQSCEIAKESMKTIDSCNNEITTGIKDAEKKKDNLYITLGVIAFGVWWWNKGRKKKTYEEYYQHEQAEV